MLLINLVDPRAPTPIFIYLPGTHGQPGFNHRGTVLDELI